MRINVLKPGGLLKPETSHASAQGVRGSKKPLSRWPEDMMQRNLHCSTYNINIHRGLFGARRSAKTSQQNAPWNSSSPPPPPQEKHPQPTRKRLLIKSPSPVRCPRNRFPGPSPSVNPCIGPHAKDSHPKPASDCVLTPSRTRFSSPLATAQGTTTAPRMRSRARAMGQGFRLLAPVRGPIRPSTPLPFHWRPETRSQTFSPRAMNFFPLSFCICLLYVLICYTSCV